MKTSKKGIISWAAFDLFFSNEQIFIFIITVFTKKAGEIIIEKCVHPAKKVCGSKDEEGVIDGQRFCKVVYETECQTRYDEKSNQEGDSSKKFVANTICKKLPVTLCGGQNCQFQVCWLCHLFNKQTYILDRGWTMY